MHTALCDLFGIEHPLVQAPIGNAATPELAAAVSNAGALGSLSLTWATEAAVRQRIEDTQALTARPFAGNLVLAFDVERNLDMALAAGLRIVSLSWGDFEEPIERVHAAGALAVATVGSAEAARRAEAAGADALVAQGWEAGGHLCGQVSTLALVPAVVDAVDVPVIAAGGIADGRGLAAALALGAVGAWVGTAFVLAQEAPVHPEYRRLVVEAAETDTVYSELYDGNWQDAPGRTLRNSTFERWERAGRPPTGSRPGEGELLATRIDGSPHFRYDSSLPLATTSGKIEPLSLWAGQGVGLVSDVEPAAEIVRRIVDGADAALRHVS